MKAVNEKELYEMFDEVLDGSYEPAQIGPFEYSVSLALKTIDRIAYEESFRNWLESEVEGGELEEDNGEYFVVGQ